MYQNIPTYRYTNIGLMLLPHIQTCYQSWRVRETAGKKSEGTLLPGNQCESSFADFLHSCFDFCSMLFKHDLWSFATIFQYDSYSVLSVANILWCCCSVQIIRCYYLFQMWYNWIQCICGMVFWKWFQLSLMSKQFELSTDEIRVVSWIL